MTDQSRPLLAVLIDADNVPAKWAQQILREVATIGEPALRRVYGDWSRPALQTWSTQILSLGLAAQQATANTKQKNASDIELVIDAMDILHTERFDGFVLVSSDSDFTALASRLREHGRLVIGIGEKKTPEALRNVCNRFIFIENIAQEEDTPKKSTSEADLNHAYQRIRNAMRKIDQEDEWYPLGLIGQTILAAHSDFDTRSYGFRKLSDLVEAIPKLELRKSGTQTMARLKP